MIKFENVSFEYEDVKVLESINLEIGEGEFIAVLGSNGAGKTSLFKLMNGLILPTSGTVSIDGIDTKDETHIWDLRKNVGVVFQNPENQIVGTTVEEDVAFGLENLGIPRDKMLKRIDESLKFVGLENLKDVEPHRLSGGQKQLLCVADVFAMKPKYMVMDEPTSMMDPVSRETILKTLVKLHESGHSIIFSTHLIDEIVISKRIIYLKDKHILFDGETVEIAGKIKKDFGSSKLVDFELDLFEAGIIDRLMDVDELGRKLVNYCRSDLKR
ncbi:MAG: ATP-binding cassette domain-containing protein [Thermotogae bacterium]|jgi:energy-coupling factor transport system ATP-binding protein|nr:ATP-binding cassette domain-containing protein [Thermotogota bacterium]MCL5032313.1 ATP-binding cassette domain-containing protein [Thermotogota bacterium]